MTRSRRLKLALCLAGAVLLSGRPAAAEEAENEQAVAAPSSPGVPSPAPTEPQKVQGDSEKHHLGPLDVSVSWRARGENWGWYEGAQGTSHYSFFDSLLRVGVGQTKESFAWFVEAEQPTLLGLPSTAVVAAPQGQLGLGGSYYAANSNGTNNASVFAKQVYVNFKDVGPLRVKLGRFEFFDGTELKATDPTLATVIQSRISSRLISNFGFTAVQRSFDGGAVSSNIGQSNITVFGARPTSGVLQVDGWDELKVDIFYGAFTHNVTPSGGAGQVRLFVMGYIDDRTTILKTDNRSAAARTADHGNIEIVTYGADYAHVFNLDSGGKVDILLWGALQGGSWGSLNQKASAFVGEAGFQPKMDAKPWLSIGYSYGSGDSSATDSTHGTFFQVLPTPRQYAQFPFYNMMNNADAYATLGLRPTGKLTLRSELHSLRLASASDLWYSGGGAFQAGTFGFQGRPSNGLKDLATVWDGGIGYQFTKTFGANFYYGYSWGGDVIQKIYPKDANGHLAFLETNFRL